MTKQIDRFYAKHPRAAMVIAIVIALVCIVAIQSLERAEQTLAPQIQANTRNMT